MYLSLILISNKQTWFKDTG